MPWIYEQRTGKLYQDHSEQPDSIVFEGYSGHGESKNRPDCQHLKNEGPIPCGVYQIGAPYESPDHGPYCLRLTPAPENDMMGRGHFLLHGDSKKLPGSASMGCIVVSRPARTTVWLSDDHLLRVIPG